MMLWGRRLTPLNELEYRIGSYQLNLCQPLCSLKTILLGIKYFIVLWNESSSNTTFSSSNIVIKSYVTYSPGEADCILLFQSRDCLLYSLAESSANQILRIHLLFLSFHKMSILLLLPRLWNCEIQYSAFLTNPNA